jgi:isopenicillin N synthase-like dioxygenase
VTPPPRRGFGPDGVVPVIDVGGWQSGDAATRAAIADAVDAAGRTVGFMQIVGHGVPDRTVAALAAALDEFFGLPVAAKSQFQSPRPSINRGYSPPRSERLSYSVGVVTPDDLFEAFNVGAGTADFPHVDGLDPEVYAANIWPTGVPGFRSAVEDWFAVAGGVARTMTAIFATALGLPDGYFARFTDHSIDVLRMNHYDVPPGIELAAGQLGMGAHTDYGIVTVLWADPVPGLQILRTDGTWLPVTPVAGALLINLGDLTERWTNDRWTSTMHRVVPPRAASGALMRRRSAAYFHDGNADAVITTLPTCRADDGTSAYGDTTVAEHLAHKLAGSRGLELNPHATREAGRLTGRGVGA